jgi:hypothetical protein
MTPRALLLLIFLSAPLPAAGPGASHEAVQWLTQGVAAFDREDYGAAKTSLQMALQLEPNFAEAYLLRGLLEYHDGEVEKAEASLKRALELNPRLPDDMRKNLEKRAHAIESNLTQQDFSHFRLQFHGAEQRDNAWQAVKHLDEAYNDLSNRFGIQPTSLFTVIIFTTPEFWEAWNAPFWLGGFFDNRDGRIRVRMDPLAGGDDEFRRRLRHEFMHAYMRAMYPKDLPVWFQEGAAQYIAYASGNGFWKDSRLEELRRMMKHAPWMDYARMERTIKKKDTSAGEIYLAYLEAEAAVLHMTKSRGDAWLPALIEQLRGGKSFDEAFQAVSGMSAAEAFQRTQQDFT